MSLFVDGAVFRESGNDSRIAKYCIFQYKMLVVGVQSNLGLRTDGCMVGTVSDHGRNGLGTVSGRPRIVNDVAFIFTEFLSLF